MWVLEMDQYIAGHVVNLENIEEPLPSGKPTESDGTSPCLLLIDPLFLWPVSFFFCHAYQRVFHPGNSGILWHLDWDRETILVTMAFNPPAPSYVFGVTLLV